MSAPRRRRPGGRVAAPPLRASLPMYDLPEVRAATDRWWSGLAAAMRGAGVDGVPERLDRSEPHARLWLAPDLLFSQTCGYPLVTRLAPALVPVATPRYAAPGCAGGTYSSAVIVREDSRAATLADLRGGVCAVNARDSHSGCNALRAALAPLADGGAFFRGVIESGAHAASLAAVADRRAHVCAVDCVTWALLDRYRPAAIAGLRVLARTPRAPGLPWVTRADLGPEVLARMREGLTAALADPALAAAREALLIDGAEILGLERYRAIADLEAGAAAAGYPELR